MVCLLSSTKRRTSPTVISIGGFSEAIAAFGAAAGFDEASLLESGENQLQKFLGDFLAACDIGDLDRLARGLQREVEDRQQSVFTFYGNVHADRANGRST